MTTAVTPMTRSVLTRLGRAPVDPLGIAVQPSEEEVAEVGEERRREDDHQQQRRSPPSPAAGGTGVEVGAADDPGDERGGLLGVPAPVPAPGDVGPDGAEDDRQGQEREADQDRPVGEVVQQLAIRQEPSLAAGLDHVEAVSYTHLRAHETDSY